MAGLPIPARRVSIRKQEATMTPFSPTSFKPLTFHDAVPRFPAGQHTSAQAQNRKG
jgi:hypothetical protein